MDKTEIEREIEKIEKSPITPDPVQDHPYLTKYPIAVCDLCRADESIYICENPTHKKKFCKTCLMSVVITRNAQRYKAKCLDPACTFYPLIPFGAPGIASLPPSWYEDKK